MKVPLTVLVVAYNEEANVGNCLKSVSEWADEIVVVDSFSTDRTVEICRAYTQQIFQHAFENHGKQINWALDNVRFRNLWIFQIDADERVTPELAAELSETIPNLPEDVNGLYAKRRMHFMGRWIKHGDFYPAWLMRICRYGKARNEEFEEDRVILLEGRAAFLKHDFIDDNQKGLSYWTDKHNQWAANEMRDILEQSGAGPAEGRRASIRPSFFANQDQRKRWLKINVYAKAPLFLRAFLYFLYRYFLRLGFLDGKEGLIFHFLQGFWYRFYVDAKIYEAKQGDQCKTKK